MRKEIERKVERTETYTQYYCDICNKRLEKYFDDKDKVEIEVVTEYSNYPEGGYKKGYAFDFCKECFETFISFQQFKDQNIHLICPTTFQTLSSYPVMFPFVSNILNKLQIFL